jgi:hypothetical protein
LLKHKASRRHQTRKSDGDPSSDGDSSTATRDDERQAARTVAASDAHDGTGVETPAVTMTTIQA